MPGASYIEDGLRGDGWSLVREVGVRIGGVVGEAVVSGLSVALAG